MSRIYYFIGKFVQTEVQTKKGLLTSTFIFLHFNLLNSYILISLRKLIDCSRLIQNLLPLSLPFSCHSFQSYPILPYLILSCRTILISLSPLSSFPLLSNFLTPPSYVPSHFSYFPLNYFSLPHYR